MKRLTFSKKKFLAIISFLFLGNLSFGQNATNGGTIGILNPDTVYTATYFVGDAADTILNFTSPSGGNAQLDLEYHWDFGITPSVNTWTSAPGITNREFYIPPTDSVGTFYYHRDARREGFAVYQAASNIIIIEILPLPIATETIVTSVSNIYPNPVTDYLQIKLKKNASLNWQIDIFDLKGSLQKSISLKNVNNLQTINLQDLNSGIYLMQLSDLENDKIETFKIVKE